MAGMVGFEPTEWWSQSPLPYHLATSQYFKTLLVYKNFQKVKKNSKKKLFILFFICYHHMDQDVSELLHFLKNL